MRRFTVLVLFFSFSALFGQKTDRVLSRANDEFEANNYAEAESDYRISLSKTTKNPVASYNLGNAIYKQNQAAEAKYPYLKAIESADNREEKHQAFHNLGNVYMKEKNYSQAVEAFKNALRNNPADEETRYNYALAKKMLKDHPPKDDKKDKKDKKDQKDKQDKQKDQDKKQEDKNKDQGNNEKEKKDQNNQPNNEPKPRPGGISKERLQNLLDAVNNEEKKIQDKVNAKKVKGKPVQNEKDW